MRFFPAEPDISTIFNRIVDGDIDLQPDFQRGEVWPVTKQQRLIDTFLRGWVVPPVLLVSTGAGRRQQVLDGQQRLAAIRDFKLNRFPIDGRIKPHDDAIQKLHGLRYSDLPTEILKSFDRTPVRMYEVADYRPEEPAEIFFRLNQPTVLTSAEKRNAFFGPVRDQIRELVNEFEGGIESALSGGESEGGDNDASVVVGFSNSRMAYDDVFARFACTIEYGTLRRKVTAAGVNELYRRQRPLSQHVFQRARETILRAREMILLPQFFSEEKHPRLNKATLYSWLLFLARFDGQVSPDVLSNYYLKFELTRSETLPERKGSSHGFYFSDLASNEIVRHLMQVYTDRAGSRVADVSSVLLRDFVLWSFWKISGESKYSRCTDEGYSRLDEYLSARPEFHFEQSAIDFLDHIDWGARV